MPVKNMNQPNYAKCVPRQTAQRFCRSATGMYDLKANTSSDMKIALYLKTLIDLKSDSKYYDQLHSAKALRCLPWYAFCAARLFCT